MLFLSFRLLARFLVKMSSHNPLLRLEQRAAEADQIIEYLKQQVQLLKEKAGKRAHHTLILGQVITVYVKRTQKCKHRRKYSIFRLMVEVYEL